MVRAFMLIIIYIVFKDYENKVTECSVNKDDDVFVAMGALRALMTVQQSSLTRTTGYP